MNILQIAPQVPFPLSDGGKVGIFNITKHLAERGHQITFLCFKRERIDDVGPLQNYCSLLTVEHSTDNSWYGALKNLASDLPYNITKYDSAEFARTLANVIGSNRFDIVHVDHLHMARYGLMCKDMYNLPIVLREHNIESTIVERYAQTTRNIFLKVYLRDQTERIKRYESCIVQSFDICAVITQDDERRLRKMQPCVKVAVVPGGVDRTYFLSERAADPVPNSMIFFGGFDWIPNKDALRWFLKSIMPLILKKCPVAQLIVVGRRVPPDLLNFGSKNVVFRGFVPDLAREAQRCIVSLAPYRIGGGMRLKVLESFAMRIPVVSTPLGCEGIECHHEKEILIADSEIEFAECVLRLFECQSLRESIAMNAYTMASKKYTWQSVAEQFERVYQAAIHTVEKTNG